MIDELPPLGLLLSRDLLFTTKITTTARDLACLVVVARDAESAATLIAERRPKVVFVDLTMGEPASLSSLLTLRQVAGPSTPFVAFGPHVDTDALGAAREAGCEEVLPRSKFTMQLPSLILNYLKPA